MANIEHSTLSAADLHEPKGVASAQENQAYVADGGGSGTWTYLQTGWEYHKHSTTQNVGTTPVRLAVDGSGAGTVVSQAPPAVRGGVNLWNQSTNFIIPITLNDLYNIRVVLPVSAKTGAPTELLFELDTSGLSSPTTVVVSKYIDLTRAAPFTQSVDFQFFADADMMANGAQIFLTTDSDSFTLSSASVLITRLHGAN